MFASEGKRSWAAVGLALWATLIPVRVVAQPSEPIDRSTQELAEGVVIGVEDDEIFLDVSRDDGVTTGTDLELWRPVELRHPVTRTLIQDRFRIGGLRLWQVRDALSVARVVGDVERMPEIGDIVVFKKLVPQAPAPSEPPVGPPNEGPPGNGSANDPYLPTPSANPEAMAIHEMMVRLRGAPIVDRIRAYGAMANANPSSPYAQTLLEEARALAQLLDSQEATGSSAPLAISYAPLRRAQEGRPLEIAIELSDAAHGAVLHYRSDDEAAFRSHPMQPKSPGYFALSLPEEQIKAGTLELFIEAIDDQGQAHPVVGSDAGPDRVDVEPAPGETGLLPFEATISVLTDYADYNRLRGNDRVWQTEGLFGMRFGDVGFRALRSGFGVYRGVGGSVEELDVEGREPRDVGFTYGYTEAEAAPHRAFSLIGRAIVGLGEDGVSGGGQFLVRIGHDKETNLLLGGELLGQVGLRSIAALELRSLERFPILLRTEVTNQPAGASPSVEQSNQQDVAQGDGEIGARGIAQLGFEAFRGFVVAARGSFQGRTIEHAGPGLGGAVSYQWK